MSKQESRLAQSRIRAILAIIDAIDPDKPDGPEKAIDRIRDVILDHPDRSPDVAADPPIDSHKMARLAALCDGKPRRIVGAYRSPHVLAGTGITSGLANLFRSHGLIHIDTQHSLSLSQPRIRYARINDKGRALVARSCPESDKGLPMIIIKSDEIGQIARIARQSCLNLGRMIRWELHINGEPYFLRIFYMVRFAIDGDERSIDVPCRLGHP